MSIETFASPGLRWGLLLEDHPRATHEFALKRGLDIGIPSEYGGDGNFCVCTIHIPGQEPIVAYKEAPRKKEPDEWVVACTKTLGRALKKAGYPDDLKDLKALVLWRQRNAEVQAIATGGVLESGEGKPLEIEAGGRDADDDGAPDVDHDVTDDTEAAANDPDDEITDAEIVDEPSITTRNAAGEVVTQHPAPEPTERPSAGHRTPPSAEPAPEPEPAADEAPAIDAELWENLAREVENLSGRDRRDFAQFCNEQSIPEDPNQWTQDDLIEIDNWFVVD